MQDKTGWIGDDFHGFIEVIGGLIGNGFGEG